MSTPSSELMYIIEKHLDLGYVSGKNLFSSNETPYKPDRIAIVKVEGTTQPDVKNIDMQYISFKVICRDTSGNKQRCEEAINNIRISFREIGSLDALQSRIISIDHIFGPIDFGPDTTMRPLYRADFGLIRTGSVKEFSYYDYTRNSR